MKKLILLFIIIIPLFSKSIPYPITDQIVSSKIKIIDSKELKFKALKGIKFSEVSDLAYSHKRGLYALSDKGFLYRLHLKIYKDKIDKVKLKKAFTLRDKHKENLGKEHKDSEGLTIYDDKLYISFEKKVRVEEFTFNGIAIKIEPIHISLMDIKNYKAKNKALEALAYHPKLGLITTPEVPLFDQKYHTLYTKNKTFNFKQDAKISAIEIIDKNTLLVLERKKNNNNLYTVFLKKVYINKCKNDLCKSKMILELKNTQNFEGLTKIEKDKYLMISDDAGKKKFKTVLLLVKI